MPLKKSLGRAFTGANLPSKRAGIHTFFQVPGSLYQILGKSELLTDGWKIYYKKNRSVASYYMKLEGDSKVYTYWSFIKREMIIHWERNHIISLRENNHDNRVSYLATIGDFFYEIFSNIILPPYSVGNQWPMESLQPVSIYHNKSYIYLRAGLQKESFIFGLATNLNLVGSG